ncbi:hypothetical protein P7K49_031144 [Saguinus oedipus]|uniref:Uncharacterized protein n=1 Tax=Saguinus oedipus TaxID=9490 RepID=A0ABQ9U4Z8_SAGOE|nr:hypothetical protein P7K49_031144 [Saguinus oedipus]
MSVLLSESPSWIPMIEVEGILAVASSNFHSLLAQATSLSSLSVHCAQSCLGSGFGGAGLADNRADLLCGLSFTFALSPLASSFAFLLGMVAAVLADGLRNPGGCFCLPHTSPGKMSESHDRLRGTEIPAGALAAPEP